MPGLMTFDIATITGWAHKARPDAAPTYGSAHIEGKDLGNFLWFFRRWQLAILKRLQPDAVRFEMPIISHKSAVPKLYNLAGQTLLNCKDAGIADCREIYVQSWRPRFVPGFKPTGNRAQRRDGWKQAVIEECRRHGWQPGDDNAADALGQLDAVVAEVWPEAAVAGVPLLNKGE